MEENTAAVLLALIGVITTTVTAVFNSRFSALKEQVEYLNDEVIELKEEGKKKDSVIAQLRAEIKELHDQLYEALKGKPKSGVF